MLYLGSYNESSQHGFLIDRADLLCVLLVMAATFALMTRERRRRHLMVVAEGLVRCYALPLVGALYLIVALHSLAPGIPWLALAAVEGLAAGVPLALLLCRWGRVLGEASIDQSVPEVFIGSALGAAVCFFVVAIPVEGAYILLYVLPVGSACRPGVRSASLLTATPSPRRPTIQPRRPPSSPVASSPARRCTGLATGAVEALATSAEGGAASSLSVTFVLFVLYCAAALQLYGGRPLSVGVRRAAHGARSGGGAARRRVPARHPAHGGRFRGGAAAGERERLRRGRGARRLSGGLLGARLAVPHHGPHWRRGRGALLRPGLRGAVRGRDHRRARRRRARGASRRLRRVGGARGPGRGGGAVRVYLFLFTDRRHRQRSRWSSPRATVSRRPAISSRARRSSRSARRRSCRSPCAAAPPSAWPASSSSSKNTVDTHLRRIYAKCGVHTRQGASSTWASARKRSCGPGPTAATPASLSTTSPPRATWRPLPSTKEPPWKLTLHSRRPVPGQPRAGRLRHQSCATRRPSGAVHEKEFSAGFALHQQPHGACSGCIVGLEALKRPCTGDGVLGFAVPRERLQPELGGRLAEAPELEESRRSSR